MCVDGLGVGLSRLEVASICRLAKIQISIILTDGANCEPFWAFFQLSPPAVAESSSLCATGAFLSKLCPLISSKTTASFCLILFIVNK